MTPHMWSPPIKDSSLKSPFILSCLVTLGPAGHYFLPSLYALCQSPRTRHSGFFFLVLLLYFPSPPRWVEHPPTAPSSCLIQAPAALLQGWSLPGPDLHLHPGAYILLTLPRLRRCPSMEAIPEDSKGSNGLFIQRSVWGGGDHQWMCFDTLKMQKAFLYLIFRLFPYIGVVSSRKQQTRIYEKYM